MNGIVVVLLFLLATTLPGFSRPPGDRPNVVLIFLDDSGYGDYAHHGNPVIETPAISKLAAEGVEFTQFYVPSPACSASRYSLFTGRYAGRSGFPGWVLGPRSEAHLAAEETTLAEGLKSAGYATGLFGKWHLGNPNEENAMAAAALPLAHGFDEWIGTNVSHDYPDAMLLKSASGGDSPIPGYELVARNLPSDREISDSLTGRYTSAAVDFIRRNKDRPFFACITHNQPHLGLHASEKFRGKSRRGLLGDVMAEIDHSLARITSVLSETGVADNTLVIFSSDNGPWIMFQNTAAGRYGEARLHVGYAQPFRDGKGSNWEGGHRVAGIFHFPKKFPARRQLEPASTLDVLPTVFELCGVRPPAAVDGRNILPLLTGNGDAKTSPFGMGYSNARNRINAYREGPWKLHVATVSQIRDPAAPVASREKPLLFHIEHDPAERFDRAAEQPEIVKRLIGKLTALDSSFSDTR